MANKDNITSNARYACVVTGECVDLCAPRKARGIKERITQTCAIVRKYKLV